jgi:hypothetical protein
LNSEEPAFRVAEFCEQGAHAVKAKRAVAGQAFFVARA